MALLLGRDLMDGIILANEVIHKVNKDRTRSI